MFLITLGGKREIKTKNKKTKTHQQQRKVRE
jgi:hypothetical protein